MDYSKCVIYKIVCNDKSVTECYVGHTTNFVKRKYQHKTRYNNEKCNFKVYQMIRENGGWNNFTMTPICEFPCENLIQACIKEEEYRLELQAKLNMKKCFADSQTEEYNKLYREEHKEKISENKKEWYESNKEQILEKKKEYNQKNKEQILEKKKEYNQKNKEQIRENDKIKYEKNKERILEKNKTWRENNKEKIKEKAKIKYEKNKEIILEKQRLRYQKKLVQSEN